MLPEFPYLAYIRALPRIWAGSWLCGHRRLGRLIQKREWRRDLPPEFTQLFDPRLRRIAGDKGGVDGADRDSRRPVGMQIRFCQRFVDAGLVSTEGTAALQQQRNAIERRPALLRRRPLFCCLGHILGLLNDAALSLGESEYDHGRGARAPEEAGDDTGRCRDILLSVERVGDHTAANRAAGVEPVERLSLARVDREKVVIEVSCEEHAARGCRDAGDQRCRPLPTPAKSPARRIDGVEPALRLIARIGWDRATVVMRVLRELRRTIKFL